MNIVTDSTGLIVMVSTGEPTPPEGGALYVLTDEQEAAREAAFAQPSGGVRFDGETFTVLPAPPPAAPVVSASPAQFRIELALMDKLDAVEALIAQLDRPTQIAFEFATEFRSDSPKLLALAAHPTVGLSEAEVYAALQRATQHNIGAL